MLPIPTCAPVLLLALVAASSLRGQTPPAYRPLRYDEDYRYLRDPGRATDALDAIKYLPLDGSGETFLTLGGEVRERYEYFRNAQWGAGPQDSDGYLMQRYLLHGDLHFGEQVRLFGQLESETVSGRTGGARPTDDNDFDVHQAFLDVLGKVAGGDSLTARLGRQELQYGSMRLLSAREGPNVRQSFDGARLLLVAGDWHVDAFVTRPVATEAGALDDDADQGRAFYGVYATGPLPLLPDGHVDLYFLELDRDDAAFVQGTAQEKRRSLGTRLFGRPEPWDYDFEAVWQFGSFDGGRIEAWTVASDTGVTLPLPWQPRLSLKADVASGDGDPNTQGLQTFNAMFPRGSYFGEPALIGPANIIDLHPALTLQPSSACRLYLDWDVFWRQTADDGIYNAALKPMRPSLGSDRRLIGNQLQVGTECTLQRHASLSLFYAHFFAGPYLRDTGTAEDVDYVSVWLTFKF
ncbi:MAG TPA: alginate export family protein [Planctomycetota bacterium]|nr:alginate export family protein [Planctomycetota bacterium]